MTWVWIAWLYMSPATAYLSIGLLFHSHVSSTCRCVLCFSLMLCQCLSIHNQSTASLCDASGPNQTVWASDEVMVTSQVCRVTHTCWQEIADLEYCCVTLFCVISELWQLTVDLFFFHLLVKCKTLLYIQLWSATEPLSDLQRSHDMTYVCDATLELQTVLVCALFWLRPNQNSAHINSCCCCC